MPAQTYRNLPLDTLYDFLVIAVRDMLAAQESKQSDAEHAATTLKKQVVLLMELIHEKRKA
jgi:hypothetical protein